MDIDRRLIGEWLPLRAIGESSTKAKRVHTNSISSLHLWFARRPLPASRATIYASLVHDAEQHRKTLEGLSKYAPPYSGKRRQDGMDSMTKAIQQAKLDILECNGNRPPRVLDPFGGGGAIPLECQRLGCETHTGDYNPVAWFIQKCTLEWPQKYGVPSSGSHNGDSKLVMDLGKLADRMDSDIQELMGDVYTGAEYIWARTIPCQSPQCGLDIPLLQSYKLSEKDKVFMHPNGRDGNRMKFRIVGGDYGDLPKNHDGKARTTRGMYVTCPSCNSTLKPDIVNKLLFESTKDQMVAVVDRPKKGKKTFREVVDADIAAYRRSVDMLAKERDAFKSEYGIDPIPDEPLSMPTGREYSPGEPYWVFMPVTAGQRRWSGFYNTRQMLFMVVMLRWIRDEHRRMLDGGMDAEYAGCLASYLAVIQDRMAARGQTRISVWNAKRNNTDSGLSGAAIKKIVSYAEVNPFGAAGIRNKAKIMRGAIIAAASVGNNPATIHRGSATNLSRYPDNHFDAVVTDPPYYDLVMYADFSDFFYVWLRRSIGHIFPDQFRTRLSPKSQEMITNENHVRSAGDTDVGAMQLKTSRTYETQMSEALTEMHRVLKPDGILTMVYSHTELKSWETLIKAIRNSGFVITAAWPLSTETPNRMAAQDKASLQSTIYMVGRKAEREKAALYGGVRQQMFAALEKKMAEFDGYIEHNDYLIASIGYALEWMTKYDSLKKVSGEPVSICDMLEDIREFVTGRILQQILGDIGSDSGLLRPYVLYRWTYGPGTAPYDQARKLFAGCGTDIAACGDFVRSSKDRVRFLGPDDFESADRVPDTGGLVGMLYGAILLRREDRADEAYQLLGNHAPSFWNAIRNMARNLSGPESKELKALADGVDVRAGVRSGKRPAHRVAKTGAGQTTF